MGFIDWICEPNAELRGQFLDGAFPVEAAPPPTFRCPYCRATLETKDSLLRHTRTTHPLERPLLLIGGRPARAEETFRSAPDPQMFDLENCTRIELSIGASEFQEATNKQLKDKLANQHDGFARIRLSNQRFHDQSQADREHRLTFRVAPAEELEKIEELFISSMITLTISVAAAHEFWETTRPHWTHTASGEYANALSNYLIGIAIKQGDSGAEHLPFDRFKNKLLEALEVIQHLDLSLARGVAGIIRFNLNDFVDWTDEAPAFPGLRSAGRFFNSPARSLGRARTAPRSTLGQTAKCPVDDLTERVISATLLILEGRASSPALRSLLPPLLKWSPLSEYDRQKLHALMAAMHLENKDQRRAAAHFRALRSDVNFGPWAEQHLEK